MSRARRFPVHGWIGLALVAAFWPLNWLLDGLRTHWGFFPLWLGYCLAVDGINVWRSGTSLWTRSRWLYAQLFLFSIPIWWLFEAVNRRTQNWHYLGAEQFSDLEYALLASLSFSTVVPAVLGTAEWLSRSRFLARLGRGPAFARGSATPGILLVAGLAGLVLVLVWPRRCFPLVWLALLFVLEPVNVWLGNRSLLAWTRRGDWRPIAALCLGVLVCGFFWEMWNYWSYPKWIYSVPPFDFAHAFEMPLLGYVGYPPFALELFAAVHLLFGVTGRSRTDYVTRGLEKGTDPF